MQSPAKQDRRIEVGARGEEAVRDHVRRLDWRVIDHNVRWREGELDLIAVDGATLVIAEVKTLVARGADGKPAFSPFESIGRQKQNQIRMLARRWMTDDLRRLDLGSGHRFSAIRFDAFAVTLTRAGDVLEIEHLEDAF